MNKPIVQAPALPRRLCGTATKSGILLGPELGHVRIARRWAAQATRSRPSLAEPVGIAVSEMTTNALRHSASGLPGGSVRVEIERTPRHLELRVTDNGPRPGEEPSFPAVPSPEPLRPSGNGLRLVEALCSYWDWKQHSCGAITVRAVFPW
ncbi:ATP-binding protein [Nocardiopsis deserti]|uniref:ATP-binding protein n=1 Tax=Nocardiopsis deserti TaxID=2605988 RepID=UPI00123A7E19|nr:ATP-binding protein [Nocardiopsis deserti]